MAKQKDEITPYFQVSHAYQASLNEFIAASMDLRQTVDLVLRLVEKGGDPAKAIDELKKSLARMNKASHGD